MSPIDVLRAETTKLLTTRSTWIIAAVTVLGTWPQAWGNADAYQLDSDDPRLFGVPVPLEHRGFSMAGFGYVFVVVLGALWAASEYGRGRQIHTTLTATPRRGRVIAVKAVLLAATTAAIAFLAMTGAIMITHAAAGDGIHPLLLSPRIWGLIGGLTLAWVLTALIAFAIGIMARGAVLPLILLLPLVVGLGTFLAGIWDGAAYLPVTAGAALYEVPGTDGVLDATVGGVVQAGWAAVLLAAAGLSFVRRDA